MKSLQLNALRAQSDKLLHLDLLRFIASAGIVIHHSQEFFYNSSNRSHLTKGLGLFVDLFFVISGYVISCIYADRMATASDLGAFIQRRIARLVPLHWLTLAVSIGVWAILAKAGSHAQHAPSFQPHCIAATVFLVHALTCRGQTFNGPSWSISAEMAMYLAFPLLIFLANRGRFLLIFAGFTLGIIILVATPRGALPASSAQWQDVEPYIRAATSFILGVGFWFVRDLLVRLPLARPLLWSSLLCLFVTMAMNAPAFAILLLIYLVSISAISADLQQKTSKSVQLFAPLGQLTYSIYMWHSLLILLFMNVMGDKILHAHGTLMLFIGTATYVAILAIAYLSFFLIETPARRWVDALPPFGGRRRATLGAVGLITHE